MVLLACALPVVFGCKPSPEQLTVRDAQALIDHGELDRAYAHLDAFFSQNNEAFNARELQITILLKRNERDQAMEMYNQLRAQTAPVTFLNDSIRDSDPNARAGICFIIARTKPSNAVYLLSRCAHDPSLDVRRQAIQGLARFEGGKVHELLKAALLDPAWQLRADAAEALETLGDPEAAQELLQAMTDDDEFVRLKARRALVALLDDSNVSIYRRALKHGDYAVRTAAAIALAERKDDDALGTLYEALHSRDSSLRVEAAKALAILGDRSARPVLRTSLADTNAQVRAAAALSLAELGDVVSTNDLVNMAGSDPSESVRMAAAQAVQLLNPTVPMVEMTPP